MITVAVESFWMVALGVVALGGLAYWLFEPSDDEKRASLQRLRETELDEALAAWASAPPDGELRASRFGRLARAGTRTLQARDAWVSALVHVLVTDADAELRGIAAGALGRIHVSAAWPEDAPRRALVLEELDRAYDSEPEANVRAAIVGTLAGYGCHITERVLADPSADVRLAYLEALTFEDEEFCIGIVQAFRNDPDPRIAEWVREVDEGFEPYR